jgi:hypothetical protein
METIVAFGRILLKTRWVSALSLIWDGFALGAILSA